MINGQKKSAFLAAETRIFISSTEGVPFRGCLVPWWSNSTAIVIG